MTHIIRYTSSIMLWAVPVLAALLCACHGGHSEGHEAEDEHGHEHSDEIVLSPSQQKAAGVTTVKLAPAPFASVLHTGGRITGAPGNEVMVCAPVDGVVGALRLNMGSTVAAGAPLLTITATQTRGSAAAIELEAARTALARQEALASERLVSADDLEAARTRLRQAEVEAQAGQTTVNIPTSGTLQRLAVASGTHVSAGDLLAVVNHGGQQRLEVLVPEAHSHCTYVAARFRCDAMDGGVGTAMATRLEGRTTQIEADGCQRAVFGALTATPPTGAYCEVWLLGPEQHDALTVPLSALTEDQGTHYIYTRADAEGFHRKAVTLGHDDGERVELLSGVTAGDEVVISGTYALRSATATAIPGHSHNH